MYLGTPYAFNEIGLLLIKTKYFSKEEGEKHQKP
jgi:hypothetical protein